jgi:hypothetical protein
MGLANIPDVPLAPPEVLRHPIQGPAPAGGEGVDAYMARLGLAPALPTPPPAVIDNTLQGLGISEYMRRLGLDAPDRKLRVGNGGGKRTVGTTN